MTRLGGRAANPVGDLLTHRPFLAVVAGSALYPAILFLSAGRLNWATGWLASAVMIAGTLLGRALAVRANPDILAERAGFAEKQGVKRWDRVLMPLIAFAGPIATWVVAGLDKRWAWTGRMAPPLVAGGFALVLLGFAGGTWAMVANRYFSAVVRIQRERGHTVVSGGPYRYVRHPGYASGLLATLGMPLSLGSGRALVPALLVCGLYVVRTALEDRTLRAELPGYSEYAERTRFRLLPGVW